MMELTHEREIMQSRIGGFGGSDAKMILKIGRKGIKSLNESEKKRIRIALGQEQPESGFSTPAMQAGHHFEDWVEKNIIKGWYAKREYKMERELIERQTFATFAHADFFNEKIKEVTECKYSQKSTDNVLSEYAAQLQWYYLLGANNVFLLHGWGGVEPFEVNGYCLINIPKDCEMQDELIDGLQILQEYINEGCEVVQAYSKTALVALSDLARAAELSKLANELETKARDAIMKEMQAANLWKIETDAVTITRTAAYEKKVFNQKKAFAVYPDLDSDLFKKTQEVKESITIKNKTIL